MQSTKSAALACSLASLMLATLCGPAAADTITVSSDDMNGWAFSNTDNANTNASGGFVAGPGFAPLGSGSANLVVGDASSSELLVNYGLTNGAKLAAVRGLSYSTYVTSTSSNHSGAAPTLQFDIKYNTTPDVTGYNGRLVFDPGLLGTAVTGDWQDWDAMSGDAWYFTKAPGKTSCQLNNGSYCTLSEVLALFPDITLLDVMFKAGGSLSMFNGNVDAFVFNTSDSENTFDFEPAAVANMPEPMSLALVGVALGGMALGSRRKKARDKAI